MHQQNIATDGEFHHFRLYCQTLGGRAARPRHGFEK
jgi:hypothetical protein